MGIKLTNIFQGWKQHCCVQCGTLYRYRFTRTCAVVGFTAAKRQAKMKAGLDRMVAGAIELRPCPECGRRQPDMIARQRRIRVWWMLFGILLGLFTLTVLTLNDQGTIQRLTLCAVGWAAAGALALAWLASRNPNADLVRNRREAAAAVSRGTVRVDAPGRPDAPPSPVPGEGWRRAGVIFYGLLIAATLLPLAAEGARRIARWPFNSTLFPPVVGPGDHTSCYLPELIHCVQGYWRGQAEARLANAKELGVTDSELPAVTNGFQWTDDLSVDAGQTDLGVHPWVTFTLPRDASLAGRTASVRLRLRAVFPKMVTDSTFTTGKQELAGEVTVTMASPGAGRMYLGLWYGALAGTSVLLTLAARRAVGKLPPSTETALIPLERP